jgi:hypothetical protein
VLLLLLLLFCVCFLLHTHPPPPHTHPKKHHNNRTTRAALALRGAQMTDIQKQIREDVTRYRYGDEQHLEEALDKIFRFGRQSGVPRKMAPKLTGLREEAEEGRYTLVLEFESKLEFSQWEERLAKIESFFGPGE